MPERIDSRNRVNPVPARTGGAATYTVQKDDTLWLISQKTLGDGNRWKEIFEANKDRVKEPGSLQIGTVLRIPGKSEEKSESSEKNEKPEKTEKADQYVPDVDARGNWSPRLAAEFGSFVNTRVAEMRKQGVEVDCSDLAAKLLGDFCKEKGVKNPVAVIAKEHIYTPSNSGGLPNVNGPNVFIAGVNADNLAKDFTKDVNDADGNGIAGHDASGRIDVADLRPGDILFYDWDKDNDVNHTVNVLKVDKKDGTVTLAYGTYDNLAPDGGPVKWENLDLSPIQYLELKPGTEDYDKWLGPDNAIWGVRRYAWLPDHKVEAKPPQTTQPPSKPPQATQPP
ncbi:MAG: LysM peptidoglycan-binding domain-containing protein, partial [Bacteroidota bacterium]